MDGNTRIWQVCEVTGMIREMLEQSFLPIWITGEIGNLTLHRSGHVYMTIKDASSQMKAVFFGGAAQCRALNLQQGMQLEMFGKLSLYQAGGEFQFSVRSIRLCGIGTLQEQFEAMKQKLANEGLFDAERKKAIPFFPRHIGVITSPSGAAIRDFLHVAQRRFGGLDIRICPAPVQGKGAENKLAAAIRFFNRIGGVDVIVLTRGGGSLEDLWPFNEEILARAIAASNIPVVSAVGHEVDFTIADFVADLRAPTPSAAAEMIVPEKETIRHDIFQFRQRSANAVRYSFERARRRLEKVSGDSLYQRILNAINARRQYVDRVFQKAEQQLTRSFEQAHLRLKQAQDTLAHCSVESTVKRGFAVLSDRESGELVTNVTEARKAGRLRAQLMDGTIDLDVLS